MTAPTTLSLLGGRVTLSEALAKDEDILAKFSYPLKRYHFYMRLWNDLPAIRTIVARHLGIPDTDFNVIGEYPKWLAGSFNLCIPVEILNTHGSALPEKVLVRFPMPYKVGEAHYPGNMEEKLRCEAATYIWLKWNCPTVPVPRLLGFGVPGQESYTPIQRETKFNKVIWMMRAAKAWWSGYKLPPFFRHERSVLADVGYLIIEYAKGDALYPDWKDNDNDEPRRHNLYRQLSRLMLALSRRPLPRIGSWTINQAGILTLTNRPLTLDFQESENLAVPTGIDRTTTYNNADSYYIDILGYLDKEIRHQHNSIHDRADGVSQLGALASLRLMLHHFADRDLRFGPFVFMLTDLHQSNIFVDENWNIVSIIDLEWAVVRPIQMLAPPKWLSDELLDELASDKANRYANFYDQFVRVFEAQEKTLYQSTTCADRFRKNWETGAYWYFRAIASNPNLAYTVCTYRLEPLFKSIDTVAEEIQMAAKARLWDRNVPDFLVHKVKQQEEYWERTRAAFAEEKKKLDDENAKAEAVGDEKAKAEASGA